MHGITIHLKNQGSPTSCRQSRFRMIWKRCLPADIAASSDLEMEKKRGAGNPLLKKIHLPWSQLIQFLQFCWKDSWTFWPKNHVPKLRSMRAIGFGFFCACKTSSWPWWKSDQSLHHPNSSLQAANPESSASLLESMPDIGRYSTCLRDHLQLIFPMTKKSLFRNVNKKSRPNIIWDCYKTLRQNPML